MWWVGLGQKSKARVPGRPRGCGLPLSMAALSGLELRGVEVLDSTSRDQLLRSWRHFWVHFCVLGTFFYRSLSSKQKPLSSVLVGCPCASQGRETWERRGEEAAPTPVPQEEASLERGTGLPLAAHFGSLWTLGVGQTWVSTLVSVDSGGWWL